MMVWMDSTPGRLGRGDDANKAEPQSISHSFIIFHSLETLAKISSLKFFLPLFLSINSAEANGCPKSLTSILSSVSQAVPRGRDVSRKHSSSVQITSRAPQIPA